MVIQPDLSPTDPSIHVFPNRPGPIHAQGLTTIIEAHMNRLGAAIGIVIFKDANLG